MSCLKGFYSEIKNDFSTVFVSSKSKLYLLTPEIRVQQCTRIKLTALGALATSGVAFAITSRGMLLKGVALLSSIKIA